MEYCKLSNDKVYDLERIPCCVQDIFKIQSITSRSPNPLLIDMMVPPIAFALYAFATCLALTEAKETPIGSLFAYGANISGLPLFYGDGQYRRQ